MREKRYTPGPWYWINQVGGGPALVYGDDNDGGIIIEAGMSKEGITIWNDADKPLLEAAPDLLDACEEMLRAMPDGGADDAWRAMYMARKAIAKAYGED